MKFNYLISLAVVCTALNSFAAEAPSLNEFEAAREEVRNLRATGQLQDTVASYENQIKQVNKNLDPFNSALTNLRNNPDPNINTGVYREAVRKNKALLDVLNERLMQLQQPGSVMSFENYNDWLMANGQAAITRAEYDKMAKEAQE